MKLTDEQRAMCWILEHNGGWGLSVCRTPQGTWDAGTPTHGFASAHTRADVIVTLALNLGMPAPKPDTCPLPAVGSPDWKWDHCAGGVWCTRPSPATRWCCQIVRLGPLEWEWEIRNEQWNRIGYGGPTRTSKGAKRCAERAARRAWRLRNRGGK